MAPSSTAHQPGSPCQPERSRPLKMETNPDSDSSPRLARGNTLTTDRQTIAGNQTNFNGTLLPGMVRRRVPVVEFWAGNQQASGSHHGPSSAPGGSLLEKGVPNGGWKIGAHFAALAGGFVSPQIRAEGGFFCVRQVCDFARWCAQGHTSRRCTSVGRTKRICVRRWRRFAQIFEQDDTEYGKHRTTDWWGCDKNFWDNPAKPQAVGVPRGGPSTLWLACGLA